MIREESRAVESQSLRDPQTPVLHLSTASDQVMENVSTNSEGTNTVKVVSKDGCKYCVKAKEFLTAQNIPFQVEKLGTWFFSVDRW